MKLKIERNTSFQIEDEKGCYIGTTYNRRDAELVKTLAQGIPRLKCLREGSAKKQYKGIYEYVKKGAKSYPLVETYDRRLAAKVHANRRLLRGD